MRERIWYSLFSDGTRPEGEEVEPACFSDRGWSYTISAHREHCIGLALGVDGHDEQAVYTEMKSQSAPSLVMLLLVRDEADIVRENIHYHLSRGVDHIVATDNGSVDGTIEVLEEYQRSGVLSLFHEPASQFRQSEWMTAMAVYARERLGADWLLPNDADEFWRADSGNLKDLCHGRVPLKWARVNMVTSPDVLAKWTWQQALVWRPRQPVGNKIPKDIYRGRFGPPLFYQQLPPKNLLPAQGLVKIHSGGHRVDYVSEVLPAPVSAARIYHFPMRNVERFLQSSWNKGRASELDPAVPAQANWKTRRWYRMMEQGVPTARVLREAMPGRLRFRWDRARGFLVKDETMQREFQELGLMSDDLGGC